MIVRSARNPIEHPKDLRLSIIRHVRWQSRRVGVQETEIDLAIGETLRIGELDLTIVDVEEGEIQLQIEPLGGHAESPLKFVMRPRATPK
jgi:hypothetical protein